MKLTDEQINAMAAELLGYCDGLNLNDLTEKGYCKACGKGVLDDTHDVPDFIHDANAVRELVRWLARQGRDVCTAFNEFLYVADDAWAVLNSLCRPVKHITLAVLYAVGKITLEQAREAMEGDD